MTMYGIWNSVGRRFVFGISEPSEKEARAAFDRVCGSPCWRYSIKEIPQGFRNPRNHRYVGRRR